MISSPQQAAVDAAITSRRSMRAFLPKPVDREDIDKILEVASRAPSGTNIQPWNVYVLAGAARERLSDAILTAYNDPELKKEHTEAYYYYPRQWVSPFIERRRKVGWDLYRLLGITREDKAGMTAQHGRNFRFFDAPVGLIFTINRILEQGSWLDYGMFMQNIMVAAKARGLDTCPQAAFIHYHKIIAEHLQLPDNELVVCAMALGWADLDKAENALLTEREPLTSFVRYVE